MKKTIVAMITMLLFLSPWNVYADTTDSVWAEASAEEKEVTVTVVTDGSTASGVLTLDYDEAVFGCEEADVVKADGVDMHAVNVEDGTVKISYVAKKAVAEGVMFTITFESEKDVTATELKSFKMEGDAYTSKGASVEVGTVEVKENVKPEEPGNTEEPGNSEEPGSSEKPGDSEKPGSSEKPSDSESSKDDEKSEVITKEDVDNAKDNKENEVIQENGKEVVVLGSTLLEDVTIKGETSVVSKDAFFVMKPVEEGVVYEETAEIIDEQLKNVGEFEVIELNLYEGEGTVVTQLDGYVTVTLPVPENFVVRENYVLVVYRVNDDGSLTNCNATVKDGKITFTTDHFSTYIIAEQEKNSVVESTTPNTGDNTSMGYIVVLVAIAAAAFYMGFKNKKEA